MRHVHFGALMIVSSEVTAICHQLKSKADLSTTKEMVITMKKEKRKKREELFPLEEHRRGHHPHVSRKRSNLICILKVNIIKRETQSI